MINGIITFIPPIQSDTSLMCFPHERGSVLPRLPSNGTEKPTLVTGAL
ncbi:Protein of unknown function [Pyronema omphalodes CBS 100304]|uniref:Uncharacterized protein n=1 Tax=Pyronema omphalodes (strain CBS 100304) TaxID=1076935 RepID=U4LLT7_PYROM|nr:Protein of unknown function [Pyronema omphalodes CBS 100304]